MEKGVEMPQPTMEGLLVMIDASKEYFLANNNFAVIFVFVDVN